MVQNDGKVDQTKLNTWVNALFNCFSDDRQPLIASALLRFCGPVAAQQTGSISPRFANLDKQTRQALAIAFVGLFNKEVFERGIFPF